VPGKNAACCSSHTGLPPRWQVRCHGRIPAARHRERIAGDLRDATVGAENVDGLDTECTMHIDDARTEHSGCFALRSKRQKRESITAAISIPAARTSAAVRQPSSLFVKIAKPLSPALPHSG